MSFQRPADYAGELSVADAYALLKDDEKAELVDVRTQAEWTWVGVPNLSGLGKTPIFVEWASYPGMRPAADFAQRLVAELTARGAGRGGVRLSPTNELPCASPHAIVAHPSIKANGAKE